MDSEKGSTQRPSWAALQARLRRFLAMPSNLAARMRHRARVRREAAKERQAAQEAQQVETRKLQIADRYPAFPWSPKMCEVVDEVLPKTAQHQRANVLRSLRDLARYDMLQPPKGDQMGDRKGVAARRQQWRAMQGSSAGRLNIMLIGGLATGGFVVGAVLGLNLGDIGVYIGAAVGGVVGGVVGYFMQAASGYYDGMMLLIVNERMSRIRPEMITAQARGYVPKSVVAWRAYDWRYQKGRPYLYLRLPLMARMHDRVQGTLDCLLLEVDSYKAQDAAVYVQRSANRRISDSALDHADTDDEGAEGESFLKEYGPYLLPVAIVLAGVLIVVLSSS